MGQTTIEELIKRETTTLGVRKRRREGALLMGREQFYGDPLLRTVIIQREPDAPTNNQIKSILH